MRYKCTEITKNKIKHALVELSHRKPVNKIFVKEIIVQAGISRSCFYKHYENITALIHELGQETIRDLTLITQKKTYTADMSREVACNRTLVEYIKEHRDVIAILSGEYGDVRFLSNWHKQVKAQVLERLSYGNVTVNCDIESMAEFAINHVFDIIFQNSHNSFDQLFEALNIMDKFMRYIIVGIHYSWLKL